MKFEKKSPPRVYSPLEGIVISDCGDLQLESDEQGQAKPQHAPELQWNELAVD